MCVSCESEKNTYLSDKHKYKQKLNCQDRISRSPSPNAEFGDIMPSKPGKPGKVKLPKDDLDFLVETTKYSEQEIK